jgi:hypothetical protein
MHITVKKIALLSVFCSISAAHAMEDNPPVAAYVYSVLHGMVSGAVHKVNKEVDPVSYADDPDNLKIYDDFQRIIQSSNSLKDLLKNEQFFQLYKKMTERTRATHRAIKRALKKEDPDLLRSLLNNNEPVINRLLMTLIKKTVESEEAHIKKRKQTVRGIGKLTDKWEAKHTTTLTKLSKSHTIQLSPASPKEISHPLHNETTTSELTDGFTDISLDDNNDGLS